MQYFPQPSVVWCDLSVHIRDASVRRCAAVLCAAKSLAMYVVHQPVWTGGTATLAGDDFIESKEHTGSKPGYFFAQGPQGLGYYRDKAQKPAAADEKVNSAARHTYDVGYAKWDKVLNEVDDSDDSAD